jgi:hypothetical protein
MRDPDTITTVAKSHLENKTGEIFRVAKLKFLYKRMPFQIHSRSFGLLLRICVHSSAMFMLQCEIKITQVTNFNNLKFLG